MMKIVNPNHTILSCFCMTMNEVFQKIVFITYTNVYVIILNTTQHDKKIEDVFRIPDICWEICRRFDWYLDLKEFILVNRVLLRHGRDDTRLSTRIQELRGTFFGTDKHIFSFLIDRLNRGTIRINLVNAEYVTLQVTKQKDRELSCWNSKLKRWFTHCDTSIKFKVTIVDFHYLPGTKPIVDNLNLAIASLRSRRQLFDLL